MFEMQSLHSAHAGGAPAPCSERTLVHAMRPTRRSRARRASVGVRHPAVDSMISRGGRDPARPRRGRETVCCCAERAVFDLFDIRPLISFFDLC